jgi:hypothetical protein
VLQIFPGYPPSTPQSRNSSAVGENEREEEWERGSEFVSETGFFARFFDYSPQKWQKPGFFSFDA